MELQIWMGDNMQNWQLVAFQWFSSGSFLVDLYNVFIMQLGMAQVSLPFFSFSFLIVSVM